MCIFFLYKFTNDNASIDKVFNVKNVIQCILMQNNDDLIYAINLPSNKDAEKEQKLSYFLI